MGWERVAQTNNAQEDENDSQAGVTDVQRIASDQRVIRLLRESIEGLGLDPDLGLSLDDTSTKDPQDPAYAIEDIVAVIANGPEVIDPDTDE